jgi:hypothetical protein
LFMAISLIRWRRLARGQYRTHLLSDEEAAAPLSTIGSFSSEREVPLGSDIPAEIDQDQL